MSLNGLGFLLQEALLNIRRHLVMSIAALGTVTVALTVLGASLWTVYRLDEIARRQPQKFNQIDVFLAPDASRDLALALQTKAQAIPEVQAARLVTKEEAWALLQREEPRLVEALPMNPLPDKIEVVVKDLPQMTQIANRFRDAVQFPEIARVLDASEEVRMLLGVARVIKIIGGGAALGLFIATLFIVHNTIRLTVFARRREVRIMQLVGATSGFIRLPLLMEGLFHGLVGALIAGGITLLCGREVSRFVVGLKSPLLSDTPSGVGPLHVMGALSLIGASVGLAGAYLAVRRFLKQH